MKKYVIGIAALGLAVTALVGYSGTNAEDNKMVVKESSHLGHSHTDSKDDNVHEMHGDITIGYENIASLKEDAEVIAVVQVSEVNSFLFSDIPFTNSNVTIKKLYKGNLEKNETIKVLETGGIIKEEEYVFEGNPVFKDKEKALVFLKKYEGDVTDDAYVVLGAYQGKFKKDDYDNLTPPNHAEVGLNKVKKLKDVEKELN